LSECRDEGETLMGSSGGGAKPRRGESSLDTHWRTQGASRGDREKGGRGRYILVASNVIELLTVVHGYL